MNKRGIFIMVLGGAVVAFAVPMAVVFGGFVDVSANERHSPQIEWALKTTARNSVRRLSKEIKVPDLAGSDEIPLGAQLYDEMCVMCHAAPGKAAGELAEGLYPKPPELAKIAETRTPGELFWVTKNGIKMTGMPAWGPSHKDDYLWAMVAFMQAMPTMTAGKYKLLVENKPGTLGKEHDHE